MMCNTATVDRLIIGLDGAKKDDVNAFTSRQVFLLGAVLIYDNVVAGEWANQNGPWKCH